MKTTLFIGERVGDNVRMDSIEDARRPLPIRVLVTGAGGDIGGAVATALSKAGVEVVAFDRRFPRDVPAQRTIVGDTGDEAAVAGALAGCDALAHLAAYPSPDAAGPREVFRANTQGAFTVLSLAGELGIRRAVIASSINANGLTFHPRRPLPTSFPLTVNEPAQLGDWYSLGKADDELAAEMCANRWGLSTVCLRLPHTCSGAVLDAVARRNRDQPEAAVQEGWAYLHTDDAAGAFVSALIATGVGGPIGARSVPLLVSADDTLVPWATSAALARYAPDVPVARVIAGRDSALDTAPARLLLGWRPTYRYYPSEPEELPPS